MEHENAMEDQLVMTTDYRIVVDGGAGEFHHAFAGEPQINLTFEHEGHVYRVTSRAHDEGANEPTFHAARA